ncbi:hypothetical protein ACLM5H_16900 [Fredinandcohnia humi]
MNINPMIDELCKLKVKFANEFSCYLKSEQKSISLKDLYQIIHYNDLSQIKWDASFYVIFTDYKFNENKCTWVVGEKYKAIYRGHCATPKRRIESHLYNSTHNKLRQGNAYKVCMKADYPRSGIDIDKLPHKKYSWFVYQLRLKGSNVLIREQAEQGFDLLFNKPLASYS